MEARPAAAYRVIAIASNVPTCGVAPVWRTLERYHQDPEEAEPADGRLVDKLRAECAGRRREAKELEEKIRRARGPPHRRRLARRLRRRREGPKRPAIVTKLVHIDPLKQLETIEAIKMGCERLWRKSCNLRLNSKA
jgi:hypothetical protein